MNNYYLVPVTTKNIKYDGISLFDGLFNIDNQLYDSKKNVMFLKNEDLLSLIELEEVNKDISRRFKAVKIPEKIILVKQGDSLYEIGSELSLEVINDSYLEAFRVSSEEVVEFFVENENYLEEVSNFFTSFINELFIDKNKKNVI